MNNSHSKSEISQKNNLESNIELFIKKMCDLSFNENFKKLIRKKSK